MRKLQLILLGVFTITMMSVVSSCSSDLNEAAPAKQLLSPFTALKSTTPFVGSIDYCGDVQSNDLMAGQHFLSGSIVVGNDEDYVYVTYNTVDSWRIKSLHLYVGEKEGIPTNKGGNPQVGQFPINESFSELKTSVTYQFIKDSLPDCMTIAAHADVVKLGEDGSVVQSETAWGKGDGFPGGSWAMFFEFCKRDCVPPPPPPPTEDKCYGGNETGWAFGGKYNSNDQGNWATFTPYVAGSTVNIYAGQHNLAGTVTFSSVVNGKVTLTIVLNNDWETQNVSNALKIQGYDSPPSGNPAPGQFTTYKGAIVSEVIVDNFNYYGIHFDLRKVVPCEK